MVCRRIYKIIGSVGLSVLLFAWAGGAEESPRSLVHFAAVHGRYSFSVPWDLAKPVVKVPFRLSNGMSGLASFQGHVKDAGDAGKDVLGGDLVIQGARSKRTYKNIWKERLAEAGTVQMPRSGREEIYFASMEGVSFQEWHFNLFNPRTSALITLTYKWAQDDPAAIRKTSKNFDAPALADERDLLENLAHDPDYGIPFNKK